MESQVIKLLGRIVEMATSRKVKNTNGKSEPERSNRLFDFYLSRHRSKLYGSGGFFWTWQKSIVVLCLIAFQDCAKRGPMGRRVTC